MEIIGDRRRPGYLFFHATDETQELFGFHCARFADLYDVLHQAVGLLDDGQVVPDLMRVAGEYPVDE